MTKMTKKIGAIITALVFIAIAFAIYHYYPFHKKMLPTYFAYTQAEKDSLYQLNSKHKITQEELEKWDTIVFDLVKKNKLGDAHASRIYAYLYTAQRDAAYLSYNVKHSFMGSIDAISAKVLCLFFTHDCSNLANSVGHDPYSAELADMVTNKVKARMQEDDTKTKLYPEKPAAFYWAGIRPYFGQDTGSWKTWLIQSGNEFRVPAPPAYDSPEWQHQLQITTTALKNISNEQKKAVIFWAGNPGTITPPGQWLDIANHYMRSNDVPLAKVLLVRSVLAMTIADAVIAVFDSKYSYWMKRPNMLDKTIQTIMPTPNHPSYPAGHATISGAASTVLIYYFPDAKITWEKYAYEASYSRVWGGIHFTNDTEQGLTLGKHVGDRAISVEPKLTYE
jgi:hypothetical protein